MHYEVEIPVFICDVKPPRAYHFTDPTQRDHMMTVKRTPFSSAQYIGHTWGCNFEPADRPWWRQSGVYQWSIFDGITRDLVGYYVGVAKEFADRVPLYWNTMSPQLIDLMDGSQMIGVKTRSPKHDKSPLRWVHLWMARAFRNRDLVQLTVTAFGSKPADYVEAQKVEVAWIKQARDASTVPLLNHERLGLNLSALDLCFDFLHQHDLCDAPGELTVPGDWMPPFLDGEAKKWHAAVTLWQGTWEKKRGKPRKLRPSAST
jgi:hypothetical protein